MERHFQRELESLKTSLIKMGSVVEENFGMAIRSVLEMNEDLAHKVIETDKRVDSLEIEIDNAVVDMLALQQPVASDLRFILAALKINNDLERMGDHAVNIAESALTMAKSKRYESLLEIPKMSEIASTMLRDVLNSFVHLSPEIARSVLERDDVIDDLNRSMTIEVVELLQKNRSVIEGGLELIRVSRNLERIGDLATNIAEDVIFLTQARVVKHHSDERIGSHEKPGS